MAGRDRERITGPAIPCDTRGRTRRPRHGRLRLHLSPDRAALPASGRKRHPKVGDDGLGDGNYLAFAIANRWISQLIYVLGGRYEDFDDDIDYESRPGDLLPYLFENFDSWTRTIRLPTLEVRNLRDNLLSAGRLTPLALEPPVPFDWMLWQQFQATEPFDVICLARSPGFTPKAADAIYDEIRSRFVDESAMARSR
jgi:hypothetical protein